MHHVNDLRWSIVVTHPQREHRVALGLVEAGLTAFLPLERRWVRHARSRTAVDRPLFPGYVFMGCAPGEQPWYAARGIAGARDILSNDGKPLSVPATVVERLMAAQAAGAFDSTARRQSPFQAGTAVRVVDGVFAGLAARVLRAPSEERIWLALDLIGGREMRANVPLSIVELVA